MLRILQFSLLLVAFSTSDVKGADNPDWSHYLAAVSGVLFGIDDQISDGCWLNAEETRTSMELIFEQSEIQTFPERVRDVEWGEAPRWAYLKLFGLGYQTSNGLCVAYIALSKPVAKTRSKNELFAHEGGQASHYGIEDELLAIEVGNFEFSASIISGPQNNFSQRIKSKFESWAQEFALMTIRARREIRDQYPKTFQAFRREEARRRKDQGF